MNYIEPSQTNVIIHPLFLLNVVDHWQRVAKGSKRRVLGAVLGEVKDGVLHCSNSFAVPFEEDPKDHSVSFLDGMYYQQLAYMFKKINTKERFVGWYSSGNTITPADLNIHKIFQEFACVEMHSALPPVFCLVNVSSEINESALPVKVYYQTKVPSCDDRFISTFQLMPRCEIKGSDAEEVSVEHLIREVKEAHALSFKGQLQGHFGSIKEYVKNLKQIKDYLDDVAHGVMPPNQNVLRSIQDVLSLLPCHGDGKVIEGYEAIAKGTDLINYIGSLSLAVMTLHDLLENRSRVPSKLVQAKQVIDHTS